MKFLPLLALFLVAPLGGCSNDSFLLATDCDNEIIQESPSPDGRLKAVVFVRSCGATTGFSTEISLVATGSPLPNEAGNIFAVEDRRNVAPVGPGGGPKVGVGWLNAKHLKVTYDKRLMTGGNENRYQGVAISYRTN